MCPRRFRDASIGFVVRSDRAKRGSQRRPRHNIRSAAEFFAIARQTHPRALQPLRHQGRRVLEGDDGSSTDSDSISWDFILLTRKIGQALVFSLKVAFEGLFGRHRATSMVEEGQTEGRPRWLPVTRGSPHAKFRLEIAGLSPDRGCFLVHVAPREAGNSRADRYIEGAIHICFKLCLHSRRAWSAAQAPLLHEVRCARPARGEGFA